MNHPIPAHFVSPGHVILPPQATILQAVATWGIVATCYHPRTKQGGMAHFLYPKRRPDRPSNALFAAPALATLIRHFSANWGKDQLEIHLIGAACYEGASHHLRLASGDLIKASQEIMKLLQVRHYDTDFAGRRARRILFNSATGELIVAKVDKVRREDWMYSLNGPILRNRSK